jgi:hypothetical protein
LIIIAPPRKQTLEHCFNTVNRLRHVLEILANSLQVERVFLPVVAELAKTPLVVNTLASQFVEPPFHHGPRTSGTSNGAEQGPEDRDWNIQVRDVHSCPLVYPRNLESGN